MLYFDKQPTDKSFHKIISFLNEPSCGEVPEARLGNVPIMREMTLVEELFAFDGPPDAMVSVGGEEYYYFSGEGYLGLQAHPEVLAATCEAVLHYGTSSGSSRRRYTPVPIFEVQRQTAEIFGTDQALYCLNESDAMEFLLESIIDSYDLVLIDELCGDVAFSVIRRALEPVGIQPIPFKHRDADDLKRILVKKSKTNRKRPLVITDGVFNVTGTIAPLPDYYHLLAEFPGAALLIDDSEGVGILGEMGRGTLEYYDYETDGVNRTQQDGRDDPTYGIGDWSFAAPFEELHFELDGSADGDDFAPNGEDAPWSDDRSAGEKGDDFLYLAPEENHQGTIKPIPVRTYLIASLARGIGGFGCVIPGSASFLDRIRDSARFQLSVFPPTPLAAATVKGLQLSFHRKEIRHKLWNNVYYFKSEMKKLGFDVQENMVPIVSFTTGSDQNMRRIQREMIAEQILVSFLQKMNSRRPEGTIRTALFASHERVMLDIFLETLQRAL